MAVLVAVGGDLLDEQVDKLAALLEGFYRVALYFREVVSECAQPCLRLLGSKAILLAGCDIGLDANSSARPGWHRAMEHPDVMRPWPEVLREHMAAAGISDPEELWDRFQASGEGEKLQQWRFMRNCDGPYRGGADARYVRGVTHALGHDPRSEEAGRITLCYTGLFRDKV